ncbi:YdiU family protein [Herbaspirillum sp. RTI4]|uniref:protein adenylyltransferase SelO n=1 Tax=Herbaspirillum sp. RTI4 TaxID=3048640 RepID=UPI002AB34C6B|nr:YdiU family protein [Herbaspirillum sp. RTI4]MDY7578842.1 YdiU family protein [Herbaspirillum sp. RTI4]MEA9982696.1 YdiU family protein [Herbaspirillum sp. RTI4]
MQNSIQPELHAESSGLTFQNAFAALPPAFYTRLMPTPLPAPYLVAVSASAAALVGLSAEQVARPELLAILTGNQIAPGSQPLSAVYSGHQFGVWAGQLGDGRAILLGDVVSGNGTLEVQLKGAGKTPYSRMGDGRAVLRSSIREFLCSEAMAALGIPTTRALCITGSDQTVVRETAETAAVVTRLAPSFIRFGSFEHWYYGQRHDQLKLLADTVIAQSFPELAALEQPYAALLSEVTRRTAHMIAHWQAVGFMHGVMNTDNMSILGLTLDYGPFGFMEAFDAKHICNHTDQQGRYSYAMQPQIGEWNCYALGQALLPLIDDVETTKAALAVYQPAFAEHFQSLLRAKLGLQTEQADDTTLSDALFAILQASHVDFTLFFRSLGNFTVEPSTDAHSPAAEAEHTLRDLFIDRDAFDAWAVQYRARLRQENSQDQPRKLAMDQINPKYVLRNYLAQQAIEKAEQKDFSEVATLLQILQHPFDEQPEYERYAELPPDWAQHLEVSCSS